MLAVLDVQPYKGFPMKKYAAGLSAAFVLASTQFGAGATEIRLAAVTPSAAAEHVQEMGRIEAATRYDAIVWRELARQARHPDRGSPSPRRLNGQVDVSFEVAADGSPLQAAIARTSASNALDGAALRTVMRSRFPALPANGASAGSPRQYVVTFDYQY